MNAAGAWGVSWEQLEGVRRQLQAEGFGEGEGEGEGGREGGREGKEEIEIQP